MQIYHFNHETGEYVGSSEARLDPVAGTPVMPAFATSAAPPEPVVGKAIVIDHDSGQWVLKDDLRGQEHWNETTREYLGPVQDIGPLPVGSSLVEPVIPPPSFEEVKAAKQAEITSRADAFLLATGIEYGEMERQTWEQQLAQAKAYQADANASVPMLDAIAVNRGMSVATLVGNILTNATAWEVLSGTIVGQRLAYQDALDVATTTEHISAIEVSYNVQ